MGDEEGERRKQVVGGVGNGEWEEEKRGEEREGLKALLRMDLYVKMETSREGGQRIWCLDKGR